MKLLRYGPPGQEKPGLLDAEGGIRDLSDIVGDIAGDVLAPASLAKLGAIDPETLPKVSGPHRLGPPVAGMKNLVCIGLNYADHAAEAGMVLPAEPVVFGKWTSAIAGPDDELRIPRGSQHTDWEVELGVVIGAGGSDIAEADALQHVAGYCVVNDVSEREVQLRRGGGQWDKGKGYDGFGPIGPWLVSADEVGDPQRLALWLDLDGQRMQSGHTSSMIFGVAALVSHLSRHMSLQPGDLITTGTPPGVGQGRRPPQFLRPGQTLRLGIDGLGQQCQRTVQA
jgi:2,4-diketo-3-deoxy-L-fuconate hydrolase